MKLRGHTQQAVAELTGVSQGEISRVLAGRRRKINPPLLRLCDYANFEIEAIEGPGPNQLLLSHALRRAIGDNPASIPVLTRILDALAPVLHQYQPHSTTGADHDDSRAL